MIIPMNNNNDYSITSSFTELESRVRTNESMIRDSNFRIDDTINELKRIDEQSNYAKVIASSNEYNIQVINEEIKKLKEENEKLNKNINIIIASIFFIDIIFALAIIFM